MKVEILLHVFHITDNNKLEVKDYSISRKQSLAIFQTILPAFEL